MVKKRVERKHHFFKVLLGDFAHRLKVPPKFLQHIPNEASKNATLEGPNGCSWPVEIKRSSDGTFLSNGWSKFVEDHSLKECEFLVFRYNGNMHFSIQVFDTTACEREDLLTIQPYKKPNLSHGRNKRGRPRKHPPNVDCQIEHEEVKCEPLELLTGDNHDDCINSVKGEGEREDDDGDDDARVMTMRRRGEGGDEQESAATTKGSCVTSPSPTRESKDKTKAEKLQFHIYSETTSENVYFARTCPAATKKLSRAWEAATSFGYEFPCAIMCMSVSSVYKGYLMRLPVTFSRKYLPHETRTMSVGDPNGKTWFVNYPPRQRDHRHNGWPALCRGNNLKDGDICAFELTGPYKMKVHIFREDNN